MYRKLRRQLVCNWGVKNLPSQAGEVALLAKTDLLTDMVGEFPELQGHHGALLCEYMMG